MNRNIASIVAQTKIFQGLSPKDYAWVLKAGRLKRTTAGERLFNQGDPSQVCYVILSGTVRLAQITPDGKRVIINIVGPGTQLGFLVALTGRPYPISAEVIEESDSLVWDADVIRSLILKTPSQIMNVLEAFTDLIICLQRKVQQLSTERVEQRLAYSLLMLSDHLGKELDEGILINAPLTHRDLAEMSGTNIYSVSRILHRWKEECIVVTGRKRIVICSPEQLRGLTHRSS
ncbi:MAG TPA: Crp/Fnr family transcriptional regulator [Anaerolineae bacterium]|nr:Crp/Fnr family transcriptional regulator [Anaerolineae bacterium]